MKTVLHIFTRDLIRILKNPIAIIVTIGVCIIPSLYAWFNIAANWDPYKNTQTMPVAVVSEDIGAEVGNQGYLNAGSMVTDKLKDNTQLQWTFVSSKEEALEGVSAGTYYAAIILPKDFTSDLASVLSGNLKKAPVQYYVNEKINPVAPKVTDTGAKTITTQINETFVSKVSEVVSEKFIGLASTVSSQTDTAADRVTADLHDTGNDFKKIAGTIEASQSTLKDARATLAQAQKTLDTLIESADKASGTLSDITSQLPKIKQDANTLSAKLFSSLIEGGTSISGISSHADAAVGQITGSVGSAMGTVDGTVASVQSLISTNRQLVDDLKTIRDSLPAAHQSSLNTLIDELDASVSQEEALLARLQTASGDIHASNDSLSHLSSTMNTTVNTNIDAIHQTVQTLSTTSIPEFNGSIDSFGDATYTLNATLSATKPALQQIKGTLNQLDHVLSQAQDATLRTEDSLSTTAKTLDTLSSDMNVIKNSQLMEQLQEVVNLNPKDIASFMSSPVKIEDDIVYPVANYGSSVTPFYTNLALWVGGIVLIAIYKLEVDHENIGSFAPWQGYFGRWLLMMLLAILQATICCIGDLLLKIQCVSPTAFILAGIIEAVVYVTLIYSLSIAFKHIGKALCVLLVILQIPGAAGLYPIEMMPGFFQAIHPWLPFTYGIAAMREAIGGFYGNFYLENLVKVSLFIIPAFVVGVVLRRHLLNINYLFDRRLAATGLMAHERDGIKIEHYRLSSLMHALQNSDEYTRDVEVRAQRFESRYPSRIRYGLRALIALPIGLLVVLFISQNKLFWLIVWIIAIVVTCAYLIIIEYLHETMRRRKSMTGLDTSRMVKMISTQLEREERGE
ncbi:YhgE/Pip family protein [Lancefieldella rimae]|uniref:YhgE/Pip family protein n=1 Tax=Lancefieldella rimae TaxID=1383 RepID=UPI003C6FC18F